MFNLWNKSFTTKFWDVWDELLWPKKMFNALEKLDIFSWGVSRMGSYRRLVEAEGRQSGQILPTAGEKYFGWRGGNTPCDGEGITPGRAPLHSGVQNFNGANSGQFRGVNDCVFHPCRNAKRLNNWTSSPNKFFAEYKKVDTWRRGSVHGSHLWHTT